MTENNFTYVPLAEPIPISEQKWPEGTTPLVSTSTLTYNHNLYIRDCLDGILMQKTTFPVRVVIFDDCSTDGTREIVKEYKNKHPNLIVEILPATNTWNKPKERKVALKPYFEARNVAKYIALCEGDDYWTDPLKLQKQVDFLEANQEYVMCGHKTEQLFEGENTEIGYLNNYQAGDFAPHNIWHNWMFATASLVFSSCILKFPEYLIFSKHKHMLQGDIFLIITALELGKIYGLPDTMAIYRKHEGSVTADGSSPPTARMMKMLRYINLIAKVYNGKYKSESNAYYSFKALRYAYVCKERKQYIKTLNFAIRGFLKFPSEFIRLLKNEYKSKK